MELHYCTACGHIFKTAIEIDVCPNCLEKMDTKIREVEDYLDENPKDEIVEVSEACQVEPDLLQKWLRERRVRFPEDSQLKIPCETCGTLIHSGKLCEACRKREWSILQEISGELKKSQMQAEEAMESKRINYEMFTRRKNKKT